MEPDAGRAGAAVEGERYRAGGGGAVVCDVRHDEHFRLRFEAPKNAVLMGLLTQHHSAGGGGIGQGAGGRYQLVAGGDEVVDRARRRWWRRGLFGRLLGHIEHGSGRERPRIMPMAPGTRGRLTGR